MNPELIAQYENLRLPRYTSYPTAPHFSPSVDHETYSRWLSELPAGPLSVYLHVPFCIALCRYCGCHTSVSRRYEPIATYIDLLEREIAEVAARLGRRGGIDHIHWGGGTPGMVRSYDMQRIMEQLDKRIGIAAKADIAIELDPRATTPALVETLRSIGTTRASLGVQTLDAEVQKAIGCVQSLSETSRVVEWLRHAGIDRINLDLMYGLPLQTASNVRTTAKAALTLDPDRLSLFGYAHVPWMKRHQALIPDGTLPGAVERLAQFQTAATALTDAGYMAIGIDHFAKPDDPIARSAATGSLRRNFQGYTTDAAPALIGLGASAISSLPQGYVQNAVSTLEYRAANLAGRLATARGVSLTDEDRLRRNIIERLMCDFSVDVAEQCRLFGVDAARFSPEFGRIDELKEAGFVRRAGYRVELIDGAGSLARIVAAVFDARLGKAGRHAPAI